MENLTKKQIEKINEAFDSIGGEELSEKEMESIENKIESLWQYYDCAGLNIETEKDLFRLLEI